MIKTNLKKLTRRNVWIRRQQALLAATALLGLASWPVSGAEKVRQIRLLQDDAQKPIVSKVYDLKYAIANDVTPFILGAVKRYSTASYIDRISFPAAKKQLLVVSAPSDLMPYLDDLVAKFDRPAPKDASGSTLAGTGISKFVYAPQYRSTSDIAGAINALGRDGVGQVFFDSSSNLVYWKDSAADGAGLVTAMVKAFDRPLPQAELTFTVYEVRKSVLDDAGIDYLAWKNGPGLSIFSTGFDTAALQTSEQSLADIDKFTSYSYGGYYLAPQFDASFIRALSQSGNATITASGALSVTNNYSRTYTIKFSPDLQNIAKNAADQTSVTVGSGAGFEITVTNPVICFKKKDNGKVINYTGAEIDAASYPTLEGNLQLQYRVVMNNVIERSNKGTELTQKSALNSSLSFDTDIEALLAAYDRTQKVDQTVGVPYLADVPGLKYLFGTTTKIDEDVKVFVTVKARLVHPDDAFAAWSGKIIRPEDLK